MIVPGNTVPTEDYDPAFDQLLSLRLATPDDEDFLFQLFADTRAGEFNLVDLNNSQRHALIKMQFNAQRYQYNTSYPEAKNEIVLWANLPVGRLLVDESEHESTLVDIALLSEHRNSGIGTRLIRTLLRNAARAGKSVRLHVLRSNPAQRLYERLGFSLINQDAVYVEMVWHPLERH